VNASGEEFGMENLENVFTQGLKHEGIKLTLDEIYNSIDHFRGTMDWFDDITLIGMKRIDFVSGEFTIMSRYTDLSCFCKEFLSHIEKKHPGVQREDLLNIRLIIDELVTNAIQHGNGMNEEKSVRIVFELDFRGIHLHITDQGPGFNWQEEMRQAQVINLFKTRGRGILICMNLSETFCYNIAGNTAHLNLYWRNHEKGSGC
ncbi:MAG: ATP-binding protein, partial [Candidatus Wallbacteria bacterium]|nr:ATP-binding protein [Candidatus Wallbacteria bacterium]